MQVLELLHSNGHEAMQIRPGFWELKLSPDDDIVALVALLRGKVYLSAITGLDIPADAQIGVLYHFSDGADVLTLRVRLPRDRAELPSIAHYFVPAGIYELELQEMLGVAVAGLAPEAHLFLPEDWETGHYPLRKNSVVEQE